jgi:ferrous iron transport protein B
VELEPELVEMAARVGSRAEALLVLEGDPVVSERHGIAAGTRRDAIYIARRERVNDICRHVISETTQGASFSARLSQWMMHPLTGVPMLLGLLYLMWVVLGQWIAGGVVKVLEVDIMQGYWVPLVEKVVGAVFPHGSPLFTILAGEFGVLTMTPTYLLGVILPLVTGFYLLLSLLEDSGYLPRIAALADRMLTSVGLNGRAVIPLILGLGCVTMGTLTTRILGSKRERFIATALMAIAVPCSAQIAVIAGLMAKTNAAYSLAYIAFLVLVFAAVGTVLNRIVPGQSTDLLIDLPSLRVPRLDNVVRKSATKVWQFMKEVTLFFAAGALLIGVLQVTGALDWIINVAKPLTVGWLGLPKEAATAFVMGFVRRDFGAAGFFKMHLNDAQLLVGMVTITIFVPCIASAMVILKERGAKYFAGLFAGSVGLAFLLGGLLMRLLELVGAV